MATRRTLGIAAASALAVAVIVTVVVVLFNRDDDGTDGTAASNGTDGTAATAPSPSVPLRTTEVPAPSGGSIKETVKPGKPGKTVAAGADRTAGLPDGVQVRLLTTTRRSVKAGGPGEAGGPALVAEVEIANDSKRAIDLDTAMVNMTYGDNQVATPLTADPSSPFVGALEPEESAQGTYVFGIPKKSDGRFVILVTYTAGAGVARFEGAVS
jgi:hypothetical protein